jgi:hypothetical protein
MLRVVADAGRLVWTVNPPFVAPAGIAMDAAAGVATAVLVLKRPTDVPPDGAAHSIVA